LYHDEAAAYACWFGKLLTSQLDLSNALVFLRSAEFEAVLPDGVRLWDGSVDVEELRLAISRSTVDSSPGMQVQMLMRGEEPPEASRMVYGEWERRSTVGFSTVVLSQLPIDRTVKAHTANFLFENACGRL
jgi:hypothetical protein